MKNDFPKGLNVTFFTFFVNFPGIELKKFSGKANQSLQTGLILKFAKGSSLEIGFEATFKSNTNVLSVWKWSLFADFSVNNLKIFLGKARQSIQNWVNPKLDIESILENGFEATLRPKSDVQNLWKWRFSVCFTYLTDEVETAYCESKTKCSKVFKFKVGHNKHFVKCFWSYLEKKPKCFEPLKRAFFRFFQIFEWQNWNRFLGKWGKAFRTI